MIAKTAVFLAALAVAQPLVAQSPPLRVMTYNIRYDNPSDGPDAWPNRHTDLLAYLRLQQPDLIGIQEALRRQLDDLAAGLPDYGEIGVGRDDGRQAGEYAAILYRTSRFEVLESGTFWFSDTPDVPGSRSWGNNVTRICTWARFNDRRASRSFYVYNVHLDHESQPSRERSVQALLAAIRERRHPDDPVIVTGDFNAGEDNAAVMAMAREYHDTYRDRHAADRVVGTFNGFGADSLGPKIDYIFASRGFEVRAAELRRPRTSAGRHLSDHFPVTATIALPD